jgi:hypothetical protein
LDEVRRYGDGTCGWCGTGKADGGEEKADGGEERTMDGVEGVSTGAGAGADTGGAERGDEGVGGTATACDSSIGFDIDIEVTLLVFECLNPNDLPLEAKLIFTGDRSDGRWNLSGLTYGFGITEPNVEVLQRLRSPG